MEKGEIEGVGGLYEIFLYENCSLETNLSNPVTIRTWLVNDKKHVRKKFENCELKNIFSLSKVNICIPIPLQGKMSAKK